MNIDKHTNITSSYLGKYVRVTKLESLNDFSRENSHTKALSGDNFWVEGWVELFSEILYIFRYRNYNYPNGKYGYFHTSSIQKIEQKENGLLLETLNSKYFVELKEEVKMHINTSQENFGY